MTCHACSLDLAVVPAAGTYYVTVATNSVGVSYTLQVTTQGTPQLQANPPQAGCLTGQVDYLTYSLQLIALNLPDTISVGGTQACATCSVKPPLYSQITEKLENSVESWTACLVRPATTPPETYSRSPCSTNNDSSEQAPNIASKLGGIEVVLGASSVGSRCRPLYSLVAWRATICQPCGPLIQTCRMLRCATVVLPSALLCRSTTPLTSAVFPYTRTLVSEKSIPPTVALPVVTALMTSALVCVMPDEWL